MDLFTKQPVKWFSVLVLVGGVMLGGMISIAKAGDRKIYSGSSCRPQLGNMNTAHFQYGGTAIQNLDPKKDLYIECPITRDNTTIQKGIKEWGFSGKNANTDQRQMKCTMLSRFYPTGQVVDRESGILKYNKNEPRTVQIKKGPKKGGNTYLSLSCSVPYSTSSPGSTSSYLGGYYVEEY